MTQKQYADMTTIMHCCRIFSDQMYNCLVTSGLLEQGFAIQIYTGNRGLDCGSVQIGKIELSMDILNADLDEYTKTQMLQMKLNNGKGWTVYHDPQSETGSVPTSVGLIERKTGNSKAKTAETKKTGTELPPDGLWIGTDYNCSYVGGGQ